MTELKQKLAELSRDEKKALYDLLRKKKEAAAPPRIARRGESAGPFPLSFAQERLWFIEQLFPGMPTYNTATIFRLSGPLSFTALERVLNEIMRRHAVLRTVFAEADGQPGQRILPPRPTPLPRIDLAALPAAVGEAEALRLAREEAALPFDLAAGPVLRFRLLRLGEREHLASLVMHHIVTDAWSMGVFFQEVGALYAAFSAGRPSPLPELPVQYADYALWQREQLQGAALDKGLAFWRQELAGVPVLELPTDRRRPAARRGAGGSVTALFRADFQPAFSALLQEQRATLYMGMLAAFGALLHRLSGQDDFAVGSPVANRTSPEIGGLIGFFVNTVVLRQDLAGDPSFRDLLERARRTSLAAFQHQEVPFEKIVEALQPERYLAQTPLFQVMLTLDNTPPAETALGGIDLDLVPAVSTSAKFDLTLMAAETLDGLGVGLEYDRDLFDGATAERLVRHLETLLAGAVGAPDERLSSLSLLTSAERGQLLVEWNRTAQDYPREATVHRLFAAQAARTPEAVALATAERAWTYRELAAAAGRLAQGLRRLGVGTRGEEAVAVLAERSPEMVAALLGVLAAGGFFVPLDPAHPPERLAGLVERTGARVTLTPERWLEILETDDLPAAFPHAVAAPESLAYVMFTSGSTGEPKGVAVSHRNIVRLVRGASFAAMGAGEVWAQLAPASFDAATLEIWGPLLNGGTVAVLPPGQPSLADLAGFLARHGVTSLWLTAGLFHQMVEEQPAGLAPLRRLLAGGDVLSPAHVRRILELFPELAVVNGYGPTEGTTFTCCWEMRDPAGIPETTVPIGRPIGNTRVHILDPGLEPAPIGVWAELYAGGDGLARGYFGRADLTAERFVPDPFADLRGEPGARLYRTGDLARYRLQGPEGPWIEFLGRADRQVKIRGFRVEPAEVEAVLNAHPLVKESAVVVRGGPDGGKSLAAWVALSRPEDWSPDLEGELRRHLAARLPEPMIPAELAALPGLPLTPNGKVDRAALARLTETAPERQRSASAPPQTPTEEALARLWVEILGAERTGGRVGTGDSFFELGGHSLAATRLAARIRTELGVEVPLRAVFETPTVAALAALVDSLGGAPEEKPAGADRRRLAGLRLGQRGALFELLRRKAEKERKREQLLSRRAGQDAPPPLSFGQERLWFLDRLEPGNTTLNMAFSLRLRGRLDVSALRRALTGVVARHEVLRTAFREVEGRPVSVVAPAGPASEVPLPVVDLAALAESGAEARDLTVGVAGAPFDLAAGPVLRACLLRLAPDLHAFLLTVHHIAADGWSLGVLTRELTALYSAFAAGRPSSLPPLPVQYGDFASWQREWLQGDVLAAQLAWWREALSGDPVPLDLPADRPRPAVQTYRGAVARLALPAALGGALSALSMREGASLFMTLHAGLQALLHRLSGQDDILVGTPIAGRRLAETEGLIGFFLNTLVLRTDLGGNPSFRELLGRVRGNVLGAFTHQDIPFEALLAELQPERDLSRTPFFQVFINMLNFPAEDLAVPGLEIGAGEIPEVESKFDLTLYVTEAASEIIFRLIYNADLFDAPRMEELLAQLALLLEQVAARPEAGIDDLPLLTERARAVLPAAGVSSAAAAGPPVHERFAERARLHPERPAVVDREGTWTYGDLDAASRRLALDLARAGVAPGDAVAVWAYRSAALPAALLGVLRAGAAFVILDPAYPEERLAAQAGRARPRAWVDISAAGPLPAAVHAALAGLPRVEVARPTGGTPAGSPDALRGALPSGALAYIAFTSGSTGEPKGIVGTHGPLSHFLAWHTRTFELGEDDRFSLLSGLAHDPLLRDVFTPLWAGGTLYVPAADDLEVPGRLAAWFGRAGITVAHLTPAMGQLLAVGSTPLSTLRRAFFGGDALTGGDVEALRRLAPGARLVNYYGATETPQAMGFKVIGEAAVPSRLPLGRGIDGVQLLVLGLTGRLAGIGELGEIAIRTPWLALGYLDDPAATAERFAADPVPEEDGWLGGRAYRTGDLGRYQPDGDVVFAGRADTQVKIRGFRIETAEVESALVRHPGVREAAVIARGEGTERFLAAFVVPATGDTTGDTLDARDLRAFVAMRLPDFMVPAAFTALEALPLTPNRKLDRRALARLSVEAAPGGDEGTGGPRTPAEEVLAGIWAAVLRRERVGIHDSFFDLGGHSLLATQLASRVRDAFGVEVSLRSLFEAPSVAAFAGRLEAALREDAGVATPPLVPVPRDGDGDLPLSFAQERLWFIDQLQPDDTAYVMPLAVRLSGPLAVAALAGTVTAAVARHEGLRTSFPVLAGRARQEIAPAEPVPVPVVDLSALPEAAREAAAARLTVEEARRPFDLAWGPLLRVTLLRLGAAEHLLHLTQHHIVTDGWSMGILLGELAAVYGPLAAGGPVPPRPPLPVQYADYAVWQRSWLQGEALERQLAYWRRQLGGAPAELALSTDRPRPAVETSRGARLFLRVPPAVSAALEELGRREGATLYMVLLPSFQALLFRLTGQQDLTVGSPIAGRTRAELEGLIGFFVNTLALRGDLSGDPSFRELLARTRRTALEAYTHQDVPFEKLVEELALERRLAQNPLFQAMMSLQNAPAAEVEMTSDLVLRPVETYNGAARFDLTVLLTPAGSAGLLGTLEYKADLFDAATAERWAGRWAALLAGIAADPGRPLSELLLLAPAEASQTALEWRAPTGEDGEEPPWKTGAAPASPAAALEDALAYWRLTLAGLSPLELPTDRPRPAVRRGLAAAVAGELPAAEPAVLLTAFQTLLHRWTGQDDVAVTTPAGILRADLSGDPTFRELLERVRRALAGAFAHREVPFAKVAEALRLPPLPVAFSPGPPLAPAGLDLGLTVTGETTVRAEYDPDLFDAATIGRLIGQLRTLLASGAPDERISQLPLLSAAERHQLLQEWNDAPAPPIDAEHAHGLFELQAAREPAAVAVELAGERLTYRELDERADRLAGVLAALGVAPDTPVGLFVGRSLALPVAVLAVLKAGGACLPLDPTYPAERLALMAADARMPLLLAEEGMLAGLPPALQASGVRIVLLNAGGEAFSGEEPPPQPRATPWVGGEVSPDHLAYVLYTSGSTGRPKGVALPHRALVNLIAWQACAARPERGRRTLQFTSLSFDVAFEEMFSTWASGGTLVLVPEEVRRDPAALLSFLIEERIERLFQPFVALQQLAEAAVSRDRVPASLRELITAGEQLRITAAVAELFRRLPEARLWNEYGPSETHVATAFRLAGSPEDPADWPALPPIGRPIGGDRVRLLDRHLQPVPIGVPAELAIGGAGLARGYLGRPDLTAERFVPDPCAAAPGERLYRTGDLARYRRGGPDGEIEYLGRIDRQIKVRGHRVEPGEIEAVIASQPGVRAVAVVAREDGPAGRRLVAWGVWDQGAESALQAALQARLPAPMVPSTFVALAALPLTPSGKVDRRALESLPLPGAGHRGADPTDLVAPRDEVEARMAALWSELLGVEPIGVHDNFFALGGHSLLAARLMAAVREAYGVEIPLRTLFEGPTIAELALAVTAARLGRAGGDVALDLLAELEGLSDEEAARTLAEYDPGQDGGAS
jgi:amino acid adenylation domain-containing protein